MLNGNIKKLLGKIEPFKELPTDKLAQLISHFEIVTLQSGDVVVQEAVEIDCLYIVAKGCLRAKHSAGNTPMITSCISCGEMFGQLSLIVQKSIFIEVVALTNCILLKLSKINFEQFIKENPQQYVALIRYEITQLLGKNNVNSNSVSTIAILPAGTNDGFYHHFITQFIEALTTYGGSLQEGTKFPTIPL